jgi:DNA-binding response OmpR family regulator
MPTIRRLIIIDDDEDDRDIFCEAAKEINIETECIVAINGEDALHKLKNDLRHMPEYIFLDLNIPRMNGVNCLTELKRNSS